MFHCFFTIVKVVNKLLDQIIIHQELAWGWTLAHACHLKKKKICKKNLATISFIIYFPCLICLFFNYVYLIFEKWNELSNNKYTKYTDSVRKHHCEPNVIKTFIKKLFYSFFFSYEVRLKKRTATVVHRNSLTVLVGFLRKQMLIFCKQTIKRSLSYLLTMI